MISELITSVIAGIGVNGLIEAIRFLHERRNAKLKLLEAEESRFHAVLTSDSLEELGGYLDDVIGSFLVTEYSDNPAVKERVNTFLARLEEFVGKTTEISKPESPPALLEELSFRATPNSELRMVEERLLAGQTWDGLAALRRTIERELLSFAENLQVKLPKWPGAGRLLRVLRQEGVISDDAAASLRYAIDIANRGVHGLDVTGDEAFDALRHAIRGLTYIEPTGKTTS